MSNPLLITSWEWAKKESRAVHALCSGQKLIIREQFLNVQLLFWSRMGSILPENIVLRGFNTIYIENTDIVNQNIESSFMLFTTPVFMVTLLLNIGVLMNVWTAERTTVNQLIFLGSVNNIMFSCVSTFQQSTFYRGLGVEAYCYPHLMLYWTFGMCNRLLPVAIVVYRYKNIPFHKFTRILSQYTPKDP